MKIQVKWHDGNIKELDVRQPYKREVRKLWETLKSVEAEGEGKFDTSLGFLNAVDEIGVATAGITLEDLDKLEIGEADKLTTPVIEGAFGNLDFIKRFVKPQSSQAEKIQPV